MRRRPGIELRCEYCRYGSDIGNREVACLKRGITSLDFHCARFRYDATKRTPERRVKMLDMSKYTADMFEL